MVISRTPFRISFFGGGTDYPEWYREHGGAVLATAIDKYCYITCRYLPPFFEHRLRIVYSIIETCQDAREVKHPVVRAVLGKLCLDAIIQREVPEGQRASAFARSETLLQLAWVVGGGLGIALPSNGTLGFAVAAGLLVAVFALTLLGRRRTLLRRNTRPAT